MLTQHRVAQLGTCNGHLAMQRTERAWAAERHIWGGAGLLTAGSRPGLAKPVGPAAANPGAGCCPGLEGVPSSGLVVWYLTLLRQLIIHQFAPRARQVGTKGGWLLLTGGQRCRV